MDQDVMVWLKRRCRRKYVSALLEKTEEGCDLFEAMKSLNIKDAIYTCTQAWEQKSWKKICPSLTQNQDIPENLVIDLYALQRDIQLANVEEWLTEGDVVAVSVGEMGDDQIIDLVLEEAGNEEDVVAVSVGEMGDDQIIDLVLEEAGNEEDEEE
ncbi:hypothetical protein QE152_g16108 [Popillia japonica]|uniref:DDE-1 domain-containing protein n=1 Tax=Popillia japonica TaxID=7064 RepID=A0AAW1L3W8_POPJA